jgi:hypothetical protein
MKKLILFLLITSFESFGQFKAEESIPEMQILNFPDISKETENEIGSTLVYKIIRKVYNGFHLENNLIKESIGFTYKMSPSDFYFTGTVGDWYCFESVDNNFQLTGGFSSSSKAVKGGIYISTNGKKFRIHRAGVAPFNGVNLNYKPKLTPKKVTLIEDLSFKQEFIYNGKIGNSVKFIYREFKDDLARSSFNQEVQYDLNESSVVGFKGLKIEVLSATNTIIKYKVLSYFSDK